jgi:hypothetical protein
MASVKQATGAKEKVQAKEAKGTTKKGKGKAAKVRPEWNQCSPLASLIEPVPRRKQERGRFLPGVSRCDK